MLKALYISPDILPNLVLVAIPLVAWLLAMRSTDGRSARGLRRGFGFALVVTLIGALPALLLSWSVQGGKLEMMPC